MQDDSLTQRSSAILLSRMKGSIVVELAVHTAVFSSLIEQKEMPVYCQETTVVAGAMRG